MTKQDMQFETVKVEFEEGIAWVTLNRPHKRNAMSPTLNAEMLQVLDALETDDRCEVLVLTGAGEAFSAGMDLKEFFREGEGLSAEVLEQRTRICNAWQCERLRFFQKATIAMVNGWCFGGAFNPLISCDLAVAADEAVFGLSEVNWGIVPAGNVLKSVTSVMSQRDAMYYSITGETFTGKQAAEMKLVNFSVPAEGLRQRTRELAKNLMLKNRAVVRSTKFACKRIDDVSWDISNDYLMAKAFELQLLDKERGREQGLKQFLDDKTFRPGLQAYQKGA